MNLTVFKNINAWKSKLPGVVEFLSASSACNTNEKDFWKKKKFKDMLLFLFILIQFYSRNSQLNEKTEETEKSINEFYFSPKIRYWTQTIANKSSASNFHCSGGFWWI